MKEIEEKFMTQGKFTSLVENRVKDSSGLINYIEAVTSICEELEIDVTTVKKLISNCKTKCHFTVIGLLNMSSRACLFKKQSQSTL